MTNLDDRGLLTQLKQWFLYLNCLRVRHEKAYLIFYYRYVDSIPQNFLVFVINDNTNLTLINEYHIDSFTFTVLYR